MPDEILPKPTDIPPAAPAPQATGQSRSDALRGISLDAKWAGDKADSMPLTPSPGGAAGPISRDSDQRAEVVPQRIPYWLQQAERFLRVVVRIYLGLLVCCAPWYPPAWDNNPLFLSSPGLMTFVTQGAVRGIVSGLGLLNLWIALRDALRQPPGSESGSNSGQG